VVSAWWIGGGRPSDGCSKLETDRLAQFPRFVSLTRSHCCDGDEPICLVQFSSVNKRVRRHSSSASKLEYTYFAHRRFPSLIHSMFSPRGCYFGRIAKYCDGSLCVYVCLYVCQYVCPVTYLIIIIIIIIIYSLKIGAGQQGRISGTYNCPQYKITCRNIKYKRITENTFSNN